MHVNLCRNCFLLFFFITKWDFFFGSFLIPYLWRNISEHPWGGKRPSDLLELFIVLLLKGTEIIWHPKMVTSYFHTEPTVIFSNNPKSVVVAHKLSQSQTRSCCSSQLQSSFSITHTDTFSHTLGCSRTQSYWMWVHSQLLQQTQIHFLSNIICVLLIGRKCYDMHNYSLFKFNYETLLP